MQEMWQNKGAVVNVDSSLYVLANQGPYRRELNTVTLITKNRLTQRTYSDLICFISVIYFLPQPEQTISLPSAFLIFSLYKVVGVIFIHVFSARGNIFDVPVKVTKQTMQHWPLTNIWVVSLLLKKYLLCLLQVH